MAFNMTVEAVDGPFNPEVYEAALGILSDEQLRTLQGTLEARTSLATREIRRREARAKGDE